MAILMLAMMVPFVAVLVPLFEMFTKAKLINSWTGFILPSIATPFLIMYFRNSARSFPRDTLEAARIDGCSYAQTFFHIMVPQALPGISTAGVLAFLGFWNEYYWASLVIIDKKLMTIPSLMGQFQTSFSTNYNGMLSAIVIIMLPPIIVF